MLNTPRLYPGQRNWTQNTKTRRSITDTQSESSISAITRPLVHEWALPSRWTSRPRFVSCIVYRWRWNPCSIRSVKDDVQQETSRSTMFGYEHPVRTCFFRWATDSSYLCYSIHAKLLDVLGLHLHPCVCGIHSVSMRFPWTRSRDVNVQRSSTLGLGVAISQRHST